VTLQAWAAALAVFAALIAADLVFTKGAEGLRAAAVLSGLWVAAAVAFGGALWLWQGPAIAGQYFAGYLLEKALSVDNIFVFVVLFAALGLPLRLQRRVLQLGVLGALVLRGGLIAAGGALIEHVSWIFYVFGALVLLAGVRMFRPGADPGGGLIARWRVRTGATPLLAALIAVETADLIFALDSIPAVFGVTTNLFVVFTSNAFAVLGLRALYFLVAGTVRRFSFVKPAIAILLMFIGVKMLISPFVHLPVTVTLAAIVVVVGGAVAANLWRDRKPR
jgi:tellurite resistance protein TerC